MPFAGFRVLFSHTSPFFTWCFSFMFFGERGSDLQKMAAQMRMLDENK
jgi:hypothetical protein